MKILIINKFLYPKGGDAVSALAAGKLLVSKGHQVIFWGMSHPLNPQYPYQDYFVSYVDFYQPASLKRKISAGLNMLYSFEAKEKLEKLIQREKPDIAHLHNFAHQISPSILHILKRYKIPAAMTMHDYKLVCAGYNLLSKNKVCQRCGQGRHYRCFLEGCVKNSKAKSLLNTVEMYLHHNLLHIYNLIDVFISPSEFLKAKCEEMGFKGEIIHLPNFVDISEFNPQYEWQEKSIVYFGRLSEEKGLWTLLEAMKGLDVTLKIIGEGPIEESLKRKAQNVKLDRTYPKTNRREGGAFLQTDARSEDAGVVSAPRQGRATPQQEAKMPPLATRGFGIGSNIRFLGYKSGEELKEEIKKSMFVVLPSEWYENNPRSIIEGFALGKPVVGARIGGIPELVRDNETGLTFEPANAEDLRLKINYLAGRPDKIRELGGNARRFVERDLGAEKHYAGLMRVYERLVHCDISF